MAKLNLDEHVNQDIPSPGFFNLMVRSGLIGNEKLVQTYQGYCDFGNLIKGIQGTIIVLPKSLDTIQSYFLRSYDLKILHELEICSKSSPLMPRPKGTEGFQAMTHGLGVEQIGGAHGATFNACLGITCYKAIVLSNLLAVALISQFRSTMYGVDRESTLPQDDSNAMEWRCGRAASAERLEFSVNSSIIGTSQQLCPWRFALLVSAKERGEGRR